MSQVMRPAEQAVQTMDPPSEKFRVIAYTLHEAEQAAASSNLEKKITSDAFVIGDATRAAIVALKRRGLVVRELGPAPDQSPGREGGAMDLSTATSRAATGSYVVVDLSEPLCEPHVRLLGSVGLELRERVDTMSFIANVRDSRALSEVTQLAFVRAMRMYESPVKRRTRRGEQRAAALLEEVSAGAGPGHAAVEIESPIRYDVVVHDAERLGEVEGYAKQRGIEVIAAGQGKLRVVGSMAEAEELNRLDAVATVDEYVIPKLYNDRARAIVWPKAQDPWPLTGAGEIVAVADSGIDDAHLAFQGRITKVIARGRPADHSDPHGHGTHVAATIAGAKGSQHGMAPAARIIFQSVMDGDGALSGLPPDLSELFKEAYDEGARIHNDSWGADLGSTYAASSLGVDQFIHQHKDMLIVIAAGNAGTCRDPEYGPRRASPGCVDWGSMGAPGTCKNALVVGASRSDRTSGGLAELTYGQVWGREFPDPPMSQARVSGDPECLAGFSSRGPCNDRRIKPDVVAPGTDILSAKASTAPNANFAGVLPLNGAAYGYMSGTSMAAPAVAGIAALVREYLRIHHGNSQPSAALLKAILINGTRRLGGEDAIADHPQLPNFHQGFGAIHMPTTLPLDGDLKLVFVDNWRTPAEHLVTGRRQRFVFTTARRAPLRIALVYTDAPGRGVQNDLSLFVEVPGETGKRLGNEHLPDPLNWPDPDNNVEVLRLDDAPVGGYTVTVVATTVLHAPQDFALVATGAIASFRAG